MNSDPKNEDLERALFLYQACEVAYQHEISRFESINKKANIYLSILGLLLGFQFIKFAELQQLAQEFPPLGYYLVLIFFIASVFSFLAALWKVMRVLQIADYQTYPKNIFKTFATCTRIGAITTISNNLDKSVENHKTENNKKAKYLHQSLNYIRFGFICLLVMFINIVIFQIEWRI